MKLGQLPLKEVRRRLRGKGLAWRVGPFAFCVRSPFAALARAIHFSYRDHPLVSDGDWIDFHVRLGPPRGLRRWIGPQVVFSVDGFRAFEPHRRSVAVPTLEWGLNWCIAGFAQQYLMIHAAVLERHGRVLVLSGGTGTGKSTLAAALALSGWRLFSDELAMIRPEDGHLVPLARPVSLKNESIDRIRRFAPNAEFDALWPRTIKGTVAHLRPPPESVARMAETAPPAWIVFPRYAPEAATESARVPRAIALLRLADHAFNYSLLGRRGFETMAGLVEASACYDFRYSDLDEAVARFHQLPYPATAGARSLVP